MWLLEAILPKVLLGFISEALEAIGLSLERSRAAQAQRDAGRFAERAEVNAEWAKALQEHMRRANEIADVTLQPVDRERNRQRLRDGKA